MDSEAAVLIGETQPGDDVWETGREGFDAGHDLGSGSPPQRKTSATRIRSFGTAQLPGFAHSIDV